MTKTITFKQLHDANVTRCESPHAFAKKVNDWSPTDWGCALAGEVGELCNLLKKLRRGDDVPLHLVGEEIADVLHYLVLLSARMGIDLETVTIDKFNKVSDRVGSEIKL